MTRATAAGSRSQKHGGRNPGAAVRDEDDRGAAGSRSVDGRAQGVDLPRHRRRSPIKVVGVQPGQGEGGRVVTAAAQVGRYGVPGPGAEPVTGDEHDRRCGVCSGVHALTLPRRTDDGMSLFWSPFL